MTDSLNNLLRDDDYDSKRNSSKQTKTINLTQNSTLIKVFSARL